MSGHSKWAKLKHTKGAIDTKKSAMFTKVAHVITIAAREGGGDPETNPKLRMTMERARIINMPKDNVERAIKRGAGGPNSASLEEIIYEVIGPDGSAVLVEVLTDNKNRTISNLRRALNHYGGTLATTNAVLWMFDKKGIIEIENYQSQINNFEEFQLEAIDAGVEDVETVETDLVLYVKPENMEAVKGFLSGKNIKIGNADVEWRAKNLIEVDSTAKGQLESLCAELEEDQDVTDYYTNVEGIE